MSAHAQLLPQIPRETLRAAQATFGRGNFYIRVGDHLERILEEIAWQPALQREAAGSTASVIFPLITLFQFMEGLTDLQAIEAVRMRTDWKFALHLSLFPGRLHEEELCWFRQQVLQNPTSRQGFQMLMDRLMTFAPLPQQHPQSLGVVCAVCRFNHLHQAQQAMEQALEALASHYPDWLRKIALPHWYGRYNSTPPCIPMTGRFGQQMLLMEEIASDIQYLLEQAHQSGSCEIRGLHEVRALEQLESLHLRGSKRETLTLEDCDICSRKGTGRRHAS